jgi:decaprenyl-phosphate phosphoribosyltransferase
MTFAPSGAMSPVSATARVLEADPPAGAQARERSAPRRPAAAPARRAGPFLRACRPRQWAKNGLVLIAPATAGALTRPGAPSALLGACAAFCLMASATYLINDVRDREHDRRHPRKRLRPVAAGELPVAAALRGAAVLAAAGLATAWLVGPREAGIVLAYALLTLSYSMFWRDVALLDIVVVAGGFVLRAVGGAVAVDVTLSASFLVVTSACALFLVAGKRYAELVRGGRAVASRVALRHYSRRGLRLLLTATAAVACVAYARWSIGRPAPGPWLALSLVPFGLWLGRYGSLVRRGAGESPEQLVVGDGALVALSLIWAILFIAGIYGSP